MKRLVGMMALILVLVACGGGAVADPQEDTEPAGSEAEEADEVGATATTASAGTDEEEAEAEEDTADVEEAEPAENVEEEETAAEPAPEEEEASGGDLVYEGTDPATGMAVNPADVPLGESFIVRGELISANLTPQDSPEFVVRTPSGQTYRMGAQPLSNIYFEDGETQLEPHEFQRGLTVQATVSMAADAGPSDILSTDDFTLLSTE